MTVNSMAWAFLPALLLSALVWYRFGHRDTRLWLIYLLALFGAFFGAKVAYVSVEGFADWPHADRWERLLWGKSILGAVLGGFLFVEWSKRMIGYNVVTGDWFAVIVPMGVAVGRLNCLAKGCCSGRQDILGWGVWPAVQVEMAFNLVFLLTVLILRQSGRLKGQHFHLYMIAYGVFRLLHEPLRATPKVEGIFSGYQAWAVMLVVAGVLAYKRRSRCQDRMVEARAG